MAHQKVEDPTSRCCFGLICFFVLGIGFGVGVVVGLYAICDKSNNSPTVLSATHPPATPTASASTDNDVIIDTVLDGISNVEIEKNLKLYSELPHIAGSETNRDLGTHVQEEWQKMAFDQVKVREYDVLLSYPDENNPNVVSLLDKNSKLVYSSPITEKILTKHENKSGITPPFLAYSKPGIVEGMLVYVNYGRVEDYVTLSKLNVSVSGNIALARYGQIFRGDIVKIAATAGAIGVIIYSDPHEFHVNQTEPPYPDSWWLPPTGTQRGTIKSTNGDPLTPDYPATEFSYRLRDKDLDSVLPSVPAHAVDAEVAEMLMSHLGGHVAPLTWTGSLNTTYSLGPSLQNGLRVRLNVSTTNQMKTISNVIGVIRGSVEPDRYVMIGNHRDAWVFGAMDPSSATAVMMEMARALTSAIKEKNWRPRRSIVFCSWDAEEYGLIGSTEFVEENVKTLMNRALAYLNVDIAVEGTYVMDLGGSPLLFQTAMSATKRVKSPNWKDGSVSVYDEWVMKREMKDEKGNGMKLPRYHLVGSGSDFTFFSCLAGVPVMSFGYAYDTTKLASYPLYHSEYETFYAVKEYLDKDFTFHRAVGQVWMALALELSEAVLLPFNVSDYAYTIQRLRDQLTHSHGVILEKHLPMYDMNLTSVVEEFRDAAASFMSRMPHDMEGISSLTVRQLNDQMMQVERAFLDFNGVPGREYYKHLLLAPSSVNSYAGSSFPGIVDLLYNIAEDDENRWEQVKKHFSVILFTIQAAAATLNNVEHFM